MTMSLYLLITISRWMTLTTLNEIERCLWGDVVFNHITFSKFTLYLSIRPKLLLKIFIPFCFWPHFPWIWKCSVEFNFEASVSSDVLCASLTVSFRLALLIVTLSKTISVTFPNSIVWSLPMFVNVMFWK